jgi:flagellar biosynthetic protein FliQ
MTQQMAMDLGQGALMMAIMLAAPMLVAALVVGVAISIFQAATQINEMTLSFVPKVLAVFAAAALAGPWLLSSMLEYTTRLFQMLPSLAR